jgi:hypothetical protein
MFSWLATSMRAMRRGVTMATALAAALAIALPAAQVAAQNTFPDDCVPPNSSTYAGQFHAKYADGTNVYDLSDPLHQKFTACDTLPETVPGATTTHTFGSFVGAQLSVNGGPQQPIFGPAQTTVRMQFHSQSGPTRFFDTEMLQLDISGGPLMIRESPTRASTGRTAVTDLGGGMYQIDSFFDVFTELSLDGGQTWYPSTDAAGNPYAGRVLIPGTVATAPADWGTVKRLYKNP